MHKGSKVHEVEVFRRTRGQYISVAISLDQKANYYMTADSSLFTLV
jgi:hypothetical protein